MGSALYPVTARTASKTCDFTALDPARYLRACALVIELRVAIISSISQGDPRHRPTSADTRTRRTFPMSQLGPSPHGTLALH